MSEILKCFCGAEPIVEGKTVEYAFGIREIFKYRCPNCSEKELPWLGQWTETGALQEWNNIALKRSYHKRTLDYNIHGVCISEPYKVYEWRDKSKIDHLIVKIFLDNSMYYFCREYWHKTGGCGCGLWIGTSGFPSLELAKRHAAKGLNESLEKIAKKLLLSENQMELF